MIESFDIKGLTLGYCYDEFHIKEDKPLRKQLWELNEDILLYTFNETYIVDLGFYPAHDVDGAFRLVIVKDENWKKPVWEKRFVEPKETRKYVQNAINEVKQMVAE